MASGELRRTRRRCRWPASLPEPGSNMDGDSTARNGHGDDFHPLRTGALPRRPQHQARAVRRRGGGWHFVRSRRDRRSVIIARRWWFDACVPPMEPRRVLAAVSGAGCGRNDCIAVTSVDMTGFVRRVVELWPRRAPGLPRANEPWRRSRRTPPVVPVRSQRRQIPF